MTDSLNIKEPGGKKVLIVGGVAGGASAAARLRRLDERAEIILFERGEHVSFANCGLPYYIGGVIEERDRLLVQTPDALRRRFRIDVRTQSEVTAVHPDRRTVTVASLDRGVYEERYDALVLAPGAKPVRPPIPGIDEVPHLYTLRNLADTDRIRMRATDPAVRRAVVVGGGFIGVEMAENLRHLGLDVALVEAAPHILAPFDPEMARLVERELAGHGVRLITGQPVAAFEPGAGGASAVVLANGEKLDADLVLLAIGVRPDTDFLRGSGIELGPRGHIVVDEHMRTSAPDVYAVGDAAEIIDYVTGSRTAVPLAGPANRQGRIAADNIAGIPSVYRGAQGTAIVKAFGLAAAVTGLNEKTLKRLGMPHRTVTLHPGHHAGYYPGAAPMALKLLFGEDGRVLGAQAVGREGVDKRIDVIAAVLRMNGTVHDLAELELSYAPPFSSAKDPVNVAGFMAENALAGLTDPVGCDRLEGLDPDRVMLLDVRNPDECRGGMLEGAVNIPLDELRGRLGELDRDKEIWVYCQVGLRGYLAERILAQHGFKAKNITGGWRTLSCAGPAGGR
jgi:NADPH-dependent 2,4-dienoyl-CoA reductase/sulfur reductase-like enzyme/rhodanese-related sulfurtransferase